MTKIISWLEADLTIFCMLYFFQKKYPSDIYTIIDITNKPKTFFQSQTFRFFCSASMPWENFLVVLVIKN